MTGTVLLKSNKSRQWARIASEGEYFLLKEKKDWRLILDKLTGHY